jgi:hypothetical protein
VTVQTILPAQVKVISANGILKATAQGTVRMRSGSIGESAGSSGISLLNNIPMRIKNESSSCSNESTTTHSDSEYSEPNETQVQIVKTDHKLIGTGASGLILSNRTGTTLLQQPLITLAAKPVVYKQPATGKQSLLGPPAKRKRTSDSGVTIIAANVGQLVGK